MKNRNKIQDKFVEIRKQLANISAKNENSASLKMLLQDLKEVEEYQEYLENRSISLLNILEDLEEEKKRAYENDKRFREMSLLLPQIIFEADSYGQITYVNPVAFNIFGYTIEEFQKGFHFLNAVVPEEHDKAKLGIYKIISNKSSSTNEYNLRRKDGSTFPAIISSTPIISADKCIGIRGIIIDLSESKKAEAEIRKLNEELEQKVIKRTEELKNALINQEKTNIELRLLNEDVARESAKLLALNEQLAESERMLRIANETKDKFFSIIAHDLKNPLQALLLSSDLLIRYTDTFDRDSIAAKSQQIHNTVQTLARLLDNLLTWSRSQLGRIIYKPKVFSINAIITKVLDLHKDSILQKQIEVEFDNSLDYAVVGDKDMIETIIRNLLSNAIKYNKPMGSINIRLLKSDNHLEISIADTGIGIGKEDIDNLFKMDVSKRTIGPSKDKGTGLGLLICKEFAEKNGSKIIVESELGIGSIFSLTLPTV